MKNLMIIGCFFFVFGLIINAANDNAKQQTEPVPTRIVRRPVPPPPDPVASAKAEIEKLQADHDAATIANQRAAEIKDRQSEITANWLIHQFEANQIKADDRLIGKFATISDLAVTITEQQGSPIVKIGEPDRFIVAVFDRTQRAALQSARSGLPIRAKCQILRPLNGAVIVSNCQLLSLN